MENYRKVPKQKNESEQIQPNEIRITSLGIMRRYISYAVALLDPSLVKQFQEEQQADTAENAEKFPTPSQQYNTIVLKAMGRAINKTVTVAEVIKRRVAGLHQVTVIHSTSIVDEWEPKVEGLEKKTVSRTVSAITITLTKNKTEVDVKDPGYQEPIPEDQVQPLQPIPHYDDEDRPKRRNRKSGAKKDGENATSQDQAQAPSSSNEPKPEGEAKKKRKPRNKKPRKQAEEGTQQTGDQTQPAAAAQTTQVPATQQDRPKKTRKPRPPRVDQTQGDNQVASTTTQEGGEQQEGGEGATRGTGPRRGRGRGRGGRGRGRGRGGSNSQEGGETTATPSAE